MKSSGRSLFRRGRRIDTEAVDYVETVLEKEGRIPELTEVAEHCGCTLMEAQEAIAMAAGT